MKKITSTVLLILSLGYFCAAQNLNTGGLDSLVSTLKLNDKFMGTFSISKNGTSIYSRALGKADLETNKNAAIESKYRIGSISKTFTATLVFKAIEEKKLSLDQNITSFFPTIKNGDKITVSNLLNHRSGIHNFTNLADYITWNTTKKSRTELIKIISEGGNDFEPNAKAAYSNSNYVLLSIILESIYKKPFADILANKITKPLKLTNTYVGANINLANNEVNSYELSGGWKKQTETDMSIPLGAGAVVSNTLDLNRFITSLLTGKIVSEKSLAHMKTINDGYGMGLFPYNYYNNIGYGHNGGIDGFSSALYYFPSDKIAVSVLSNGNNYPNEKILIACLNAIYGRKIEIPAFKNLLLTSQDLDQYLGVYGSPTFPLKITITKNNNILITQATGQGAIPMEAIEKDVFEFSAAGIVLNFEPSKKQMTLKQGGRTFILTRE